MITAGYAVALGLPLLVLLAQIRPEQGYRAQSISRASIGKRSTSASDTSPIAPVRGVENESSATTRARQRGTWSR